MCRWLCPLIDNGAKFLGMESHPFPFGLEGALIEVMLACNPSVWEAFLNAHEPVRDNPVFRNVIHAMKFSTNCEPGIKSIRVDHPVRCFKTSPLVAPTPDLADTAETEQSIRTTHSHPESESC
jgi:hypothetical protein